MKLSNVFKTISLALVFLIFFLGILACIYHEINMEYKYTAEVSCYDKYNSKINNLTCTHEVYCGPWQRQVRFRDGFLSCKDDVLVSGAEE